MVAKRTDLFDGSDRRQDGCRKIDGGTGIYLARLGNERWRSVVVETTTHAGGRVDGI